MAKSKMKYLDLNDTGYGEKFFTGKTVD